MHLLELGHFVIISVFVTVEHNDVTNNGGQREQSKACPEVEQSGDNSKLARLAVHVHDEVDAVGLDESSLVLVEVISMPEVGAG